MLPETLSNGICSLKPKVDRLCFVCDMQIDRSGQVTKSKFHEAVMRSHKRLTYTQVWNAVGDGVPGEDREQARAFIGDQMPQRSEEHTSELQSLMRISSAVFCLQKQLHTHHNMTKQY